MTESESFKGKCPTCGQESLKHQVATLEQELRETSGYCEQLKARVETGNRLRGESDDRLTEATTLLERVRRAWYCRAFERALTPTPSPGAGEGGIA